MYNLRLRPWPFKDDEVVTLYWIESPKLNKNNLWTVKIIFKRKNGELKEVVFPWGIIPYCRYGGKYVDGRLKRDGSIGKIYVLKIDESTKFELHIGFDMPINLYSFYKKQEYGVEKIISFEYKNIVYYVPCIELIRSLLATNRKLANQLKDPQGLEVLFDSIQTKGNSIEVELSRDVPRAMINDEAIMHLLWLKYDEVGNKLWRQVFQDWFINQKVNVYHDIHNTIQLIPQFNSKTKWSVRGQRQGNSIFIYEILGISGLGMPFNVINYYHHSMLKYQQSNEPKKKKYVGDDNGKDKEPLEHDEITESTNSSIEERNIAVATTLFGFNNRPQVKKNPRRTQKQREKENEDTKEILVGNQERDTVSGQDGLSEGEIDPLEFVGTKKIPIEQAQGLEEFLRVVQYIKQQKKNVEVDIVEVPLGTSFSFYPDGSRRPCAIMRIIEIDRLPIYILEIGRKDKWSISSLILKFTYYQEEKTEMKIIQILNTAVWNKGHWNIDFIKDLKVGYTTLRHLQKDNIIQVSERILSKLQIKD